ncbi:molybdate ABC transporter permease subunit [Nakamurella sp. YIM 132087]|uniref:Molybdenum transport system permease n=1 Tax=Nakamurella alba TaxID=2665158 RepID=A0A7K1FW11_9ACTN|nr:molybdate ABC transporter permease subunit [Nakamurella alba]
MRRPRSQVPRVLYIPATIGALFLLLPLVALLVRADWPALPSAITSGPALRALRLSLETALAATVVCLILGIPMALVLARRDGRIIRVLRAMVTLPLVLPPMVGGIALLYLLGRLGLIGKYLDLWFDYQIAFTTTAVVIAEAFVALPFLVLSLEGALRTAGTGYETVAATLGAGNWTVFRRVTLPLVGPGLLAATVLCFARALGEFGATALFAGNSDGVTRTMPLAIYTAFNGSGVDQDTAIALSLLLVAVAILIMALVQPRRIRSAT